RFAQSSDGASLSFLFFMLYIIGTPIGNLEDISLRALRILGEVDFILCEDTRVTGKLLKHYKIKTPTISYHQHSKLPKVERILELLTRGKDLALVSDAGTPGISDPGGKLVQAAIEKFGDQIQIESVPGTSAVTAALSISGVHADKFLFLGFPPHKKGRQKFLKKIMESEFTVVVYESKHRIIKFLEELLSFIPADIRALTGKKAMEDKEKKLQSVIVCRELSKMHETVYRGDIENIIKEIKEDKNAQKGEFVVIINTRN
ncbi:MAG: 16S rRNA (cytidine(1402)-2'-O)-methyltransferase, partial [Patescibacteria group bacterium]|nr:16S rRNA (cytidine(1402)-2'-O)-methyltransferase [Patescibacteria group bacterium]